MKYKYQAKTKEGEIQMGFVEAADKDAAVNILVSHDLFILSLEPAEAVRWYDRVASYFGGVKRKDMVIFSRQLSVLLEAKIPLNTVLKTLYEQTANKTLREAIFEVAEDVDSGLAFSQALERQGNVFPDFFVSMVRAAEVTGNMERIVGFLADYIEKEDAIIMKARSAVIYPAIIVSLFVVVGVVLVTYVFPQIVPVFQESGVTLPFFTRLLIGAGDFLNKWWFAVAAAFLIILVMILDYLRTEEGKSLWDDLKVRLPILKKVYLPLVVTRFSNASAMLLKGGIPVAQAMEIVGETVENIFYRDILHQVSQKIREGEPLSQSLSRYPEYFPILVPQMLAVGEATGQLDQIFSRLSSFYGREVESVINNLVDLIQPVLMITIGILVAILFASVLLPLYQLTAVIR